MFSLEVNAMQPDMSTYQDSPLACSDMGWCRPPSVWSQMGTRTPPGVWARGETGGQASATLCSRWREAGPSCGTPAAGRPVISEWLRTCWAVPGSSGLSPSPPWHLSFSSAFSQARPPPFLPISPLRLPASSQAGFSLLGPWMKRDWTGRSSWRLRCR